MSGLTLGEMAVIGIVLEGFFYGLYFAIFSMYIIIQLDASDPKEGIHKTRNILLYPLCLLYILSTATFVLDITRVTSEFSNPNPSSNSALVQALHLGYTSVTTIGLCDFISQAILIYRCWIIWGRNIRVIIIPSFLALAYLATWLATNGSTYIESHEIVVTYLGYKEGLTSLSTSLIVNAVVTGLILLRILKVYWEVKPTFENQTSSVGGTNAKLRSIIFIIIESGIAMFAIQLIRVVLTVLQLINKLINIVYLIIGIHQMLNGITPTIILLRVSMGLSYHDEKSMVETAASWRFASYNRNPGPEIGVQQP